MSDHSVTNMLNNLRQGVEVSQAQSLIWERFFHRLKSFADKRLGQNLRRVVDGEDIALDALHDFFVQIEKNEAFPQLSDREGLWPLLAKIASRKTINQFKQSTAKKRGGGDVRGESVFADMENDVARGIEQIEKDLTPEFADELFLGFDDVLSELKRHDAKFYDVAVMRLKGYSTTDIAKELGYKNAKTPERIIKQIRILWRSFHDGLAKLTVLHQSQEQFETKLNEEPTIVGRQRQGEAEPHWNAISEIDGQPTRRVVVAKSSDKTVSRNHATIQIKDENHIEVVNTSTKSKIVLNSELVLDPGQDWRTTDSCTIQLNVSLGIHVDLN